MGTSAGESIRVLVAVGPSTVARESWGPVVADALADRFDVVTAEDPESALRVDEAPDAIAAVGGPDWLGSCAEIDSVRFVQLSSVGVNPAHLEPFFVRGVRAASVPGATSAVALAEHAILLMLAAARRMRHLVEHGAAAQPVEGVELAGKTALIVGMGASGSETARRCAALGMHVIGVRRDETINAEPPDRLGVAELVPLSQIDSALTRADVVSLHLPANADTVGLLDARRLALLPRRALVVNVSRGGLVDEEAMAAAIGSGHLAGGGFDVMVEEPISPNHPFLLHDSLVLSPHIAGLTREVIQRRAEFMTRNLLRFFTDGSVEFEVYGQPTEEKESHS